MLAVANLILSQKNNKMQQEFYFEFAKDDFNTTLANLQRVLKLTHIIISDASSVFAEQVIIRMDEKVDDKLREGFRSDIQKYLEVKRNTELFQSVLLFLKNICEGHYYEMQRFLFKQRKPGEDGELEEFSKPILFVEWIADYLLDRYCAICSPLNYMVGCSIINTLIEIVQGNLLPEIKPLCMNSKLLMLLYKLYEKVQSPSETTTSKQRPKKLLSLIGNEDNSQGGDKTQESSDENTWESLGDMPQEAYEGTVYYFKSSLVSKIFNLLFSLIEVSDDVNRNYLADSFEWKKVLAIETRNIFRFFELRWKITPDKDANVSDHYFKHLDTYLRNSLTDLIFERFLLPTLSFLINIKLIETHGRKTKLIDSLHNEIKKDRAHVQLIKLIEKLSKKYIKTIEVIDQNEKLRRILFPKFIICHYLNESEKKKLLYYLDRSSYESKMGEFIGSKKILGAKMRDDYNKEQAGGIQSIIKHMNKFLNLLFIVCTFILNGLLFSPTNTLNDAADHDYLLFTVLAILNLIFSFLILILWLGHPENYFGYLSRWESYNQRKLKKYGKIQTEDFINWVNDPSYLEHEDLVKILHTCGPYNEILHLDSGRPADLR